MVKELQDNIKLQEGFLWHDDSPLFNPYRFKNAEGEAETRFGWQLIVQEADPPGNAAPLVGSVLVTARATSEWDYDLLEPEAAQMRIDEAQRLIQKTREELN